MDPQFDKPLADLPDPLPVPPVPRPRGGHPPAVSLRPPGSKSLTNRLLLLAALADGESCVRRPLLGADDAERMLTALETLGAAVDRSDPEAVRIRGVGGRWRVGPGGVTLDLGNAGTATRFLAAAALLADGPVVIDGNARMRQRPIGELVEALTRLGAGVECLGEPGFPPLRVRPLEGRRPTTPTVRLGPTASSQFVSALLLTAPFLEGGLTVVLEGPVTSASYVRMTCELLHRLGAHIKTSDDLRVVRILPGLSWFDAEVEPDASGATYFWAGAALLPGAACRVEGLGEDSLQADAGFPDVLSRMGVGVSAEATRRAIACRGPDRLGPVMADMSDMPDAAMTLAVCCAFAPGTSIIRGVRTLRVKECDRIEALRSELGKVGVEVADRVGGDDDVMTVTPPERGLDLSEAAPPVEFDTYDDHRVAMSLALVGLRRPNVSVRDPGCVAKTYPTFWRDLGLFYR